MKLFLLGFLAGCLITSHFFNDDYLLYFVAGLFTTCFILYKSYQTFDKECADFWEEEYE